MKYPKISIITPSYNQGDYIEQTITSVINQEYSNLEYFIIDGGSSDNSVDIIKSYEGSINYWVSEKDKGQCDAINKGFQLVTGDVVNWLNSDDYYEKDTLCHLAKQFEDRTITCYIGVSRIFGGGNEHFSSGTDIYINNLEKTIGWARIDQPETFFRKTVIDRIGDLNECLHYVMDKDLWIRYLCAFGISGIKKDKKLLVHFRHHDNSKTISMKERFNQETIDLFYTYAVHFGLIKYSDLFRSLWQVSLLPLKFFPAELSNKQWINVFNYFLLYKAFAAYAENDYNKAKMFFSYIDVSLLAPEDRLEFSKIRLRMKILPISLKKVLNRF